MSDNTSQQPSIALWRRVARRTKQGAAVAVTRTSSLIKTAAKKLWSWNKKARDIGNAGLIKLGLAVTGTVRFLARFALAVISFVVVVAVLVALAVIFLVLLGVGVVINAFDTYIHGFFLWLAHRREEKISFAAFRAHRTAEAESRLNDLAEKLSRLVPEPDETDEETEDDMVVPETTREIRSREVLVEKAKLQVQADLDNETESFPGARVTQVASATPYTEPGTSYEPENVILQVMGRWLDKHPDESPVTFSFENPWSLADQIEAVTVMRYTAPDRGERSYWEGRRQALVRYHDNPHLLEQHGRAWALTYQQLKSNRDLSMTGVRVGFSDMVADLKVQRDKLDQGQRVKQGHRVG